MDAASINAKQLGSLLSNHPAYSAIQDKVQNLPGAIASKAHDDVSIAMLTPEKTQALLNRQIADKLKERFGEEGIELKGLQAEDFTPDKVSERILSFVSGRILAGGNNAEQNELMAQAREGIEQGFAQAKDILEGLSVLNGKVAEDIETTYDKIQDGLSRLQDKIDGVDVDKDAEKNIAQKEMQQVEQAAMKNSYSREENTRIEIMTQDGDKILIDLFKEQSAQSTQSYSRNEAGESYSLSRTINASVQLNYQVEGELDKDEQKAIDELLKDVAKVSDSFFSGNVQNAFKQAIKMDFDSEELTSFALNMDYQEKREVAISTYTNVQAQPDKALADNDQSRKVQPLENNGLKDMGQFIKDLNQLFEHPFVMHKFEQPEKGIGQLLKGMNEALHSDEMKQLEKESASLLDSLIEQLKNRHSANTVDNSGVSEEQKESLT